MQKKYFDMEGHTFIETEIKDMGDCDFCGNTALPIAQGSFPKEITHVVYRTNPVQYFDATIEQVVQKNDIIELVQSGICELCVKQLASKSWKTTPSSQS